MVVLNLVKHHNFWTEWVSLMLCIGKFNCWYWCLNIGRWKSIFCTSFDDLCTASCGYCSLSLVLYVFRFDFLDFGGGGIVASGNFLSLNILDLLNVQLGRFHFADSRIINSYQYFVYIVTTCKYQSLGFLVLGFDIITLWSLCLKKFRQWLFCQIGSLWTWICLKACLDACSRCRYFLLLWLSWLTSVLLTLFNNFSAIWAIS